MTDPAVLKILERVEDWMHKLDEKLERLLTARPASSALVGAIAADDDLDGQYGDPEVRRDPPKWDGPSYQGVRLSQISDKTYLLKLAGFLDWQAGKDEQKTDDDKAKKYAFYKRRDAARARGWAQRLENGKRKPQVESEEFPF